MAILMCHLPSRLSLETTKELIPISAASVGVSGKLLCCLSPLPPSLGHSIHSSLPGSLGSVGSAAGSVSQRSPFPHAHKCRQLISSQARLSYPGLEAEGSGQAMGTTLKLQLMSPLCVSWDHRDLSGQGSVLCLSPATWKLAHSMSPWVHCQL